jgi:hypothetical protein
MSKRKAIIFIIMILILILGIGISAWLIYNNKISLQASSQPYSAKLVKQDPKGTLNLKIGQVEKITVTYTNTGTSTWQKEKNNNVYLILVDKKASSFWVPNNDLLQKITDSKYHTSGWVNSYSINFIQNSVVPTKNANFIFYIQAPAKKGNYPEKFCLFYTSNNLSKKIPNSDVTISVKVNENVAKEEINKSSSVYQQAQADLNNSDEIAKIRDQVKNEKDSVKRIELLKQIANLEKNIDPEQTKKDLEEAKKIANEISDPKQKEEALKSIDEESEKLTGTQLENEVKETSEAKTKSSAQNPQTEHKGWKIVGTTTGGIAGGAAIGAGVGSVVPVVGTGVGAIGGGIIGGIGGLIGGLLGF